jgi:FAD binding domain-containing protein
VIVGGGAAGLRAAIAAAESAAAPSVALVSKVYPMRSHTVAAGGGAAAALREDDSLELHAFEHRPRQRLLVDQDAVEAFVAEAPAELIRLERWGCPRSREPDGRLAVRAFGGMSVKRTLFAADRTGFHLLHTLFQTSLRYERIVRYDEWFVSRLLVANGTCAGVAAIDLRDLEVRCLAAKAVILCTGGAGDSGAELRPSARTMVPWGRLDHEEIEGTLRRGAVRAIDDRGRAAMSPLAGCGTVASRVAPSMGSPHLEQEDRAPERTREPDGRDWLGSSPERWPSDDPTGGRRLSRRLRVALPVAAVLGAAIGVPLAALSSDWWVALWLCLGAATAVGIVIAAIEDGRVQRRVEAQRRRRGPGRDGDGAAAAERPAQTRAERPERTRSR